MRSLIEVHLHLHLHLHSPRTRMHCPVPHGPFCRANIWKLPEFGTGSELDDDALAAIREATVAARGLCGDVTLLDAAEKVLARGAAAAALTAALQRAVEARYVGLGLGLLLLLRPATRHTPIVSAQTHERTARTCTRVLPAPMPEEGITHAALPRPHFGQRPPNPNHV